MGQVLHASARTTEVVRRTIQNSQERLRALSARYGINQKTVAKWKKRASVTDRTTGSHDCFGQKQSLDFYRSSDVTDCSQLGSAARVHAQDGSFWPIVRVRRPKLDGCNRCNAEVDAVVLH